MGKKLKIVLLVGCLFSILTPGSFGEARFLQISGQKALKILRIEKIKKSRALTPVFSGDLKKQVDTLIQRPVVYIENSPLADCYRSQPFLFGFLTLFAVVSLAALGFIFHLIRNDPRFY